MTERVSVVIPVRDAERYLGEALGSVAAQTRPADEVVVVDDGSRDGSVAVAERFGARVLRTERPGSGSAAARNRGIEAASGDLLAFLDADDLWEPDKLERQTRTLRERPDVDLVFGAVRQFASAELGGRETPPRPGQVFGSLLVRRAAAERIGPIATEWRAGYMVDWLLRAREAGLVELTTDELVLHRRVHDANVSLEPGSRTDLARALKHGLDRRRRGGTGG